MSKGEAKIITCISPTALIDPSAQLGKDVCVGPFAIIERDVIIGDGTWIDAHTHIKPFTTVGKDCKIFHGAVVGEIPQDLKFEGEKSELIIGNSTTIREFCTLNRGTKDSGRSEVGSHCLLMAYVHIAHDCFIGDYSILANGVQLGVGLVCRFHAVHSTIRQLVHSGTYGRPISMKVHRTGGPWAGEPSHWRMKRDQCGGFLMEVNAHEIDFMRWTLGIGTEDRVSSVHASGGIYLQPHTDYADLVFLTMRFTNGAIGFLHAGQVSALGGYGGAVDCEKGSLHFPTIWGENSQIQIRTFDGQTETIPATEIAGSPPVKAEIQAFIEAILQGQLPPVTGTDGRAATEIALAAYQSIRTGQVVSLPL